MGSKCFVHILFVLGFATICFADVYMHNPRGSNDRNCERNVNRDNGNRLFDSQNNAKGGYACPRAVGDESTQDEDGNVNFGTFTQNKKMYYYEGSILPIEWTNQHGCGMNSKVNCEIVIQYMCEDTADPQVDNFWPFTDGKNNANNVGTQHFRSDTYIGAPRDGIPTSSSDAATDTIPDDEGSAIPDTAADRRYGMHESYDYYQLCQRTERNKGLYTADQRMRRNDQRGTRQNPNGNRNGLECPEERDYYPWWHPSPWIDIAVLTSEADGECDSSDENCYCSTDDGSCATQRCNFYLQNSMNTNKKGYCDVDHSTGSVSTKTSTSAWNNNYWYNNEAACTAAGFTWYTVSHSDNLDLDPPVCAKTQFSRVNQLGNAIDQTVTDTSDVPHGINGNRYIWTIPTIPTATSTSYFTGVNNQGMEDAYQSCVLRIRYNVTTSDFPVWPPDAMEDGHEWKYSMVDWKNNSLTEGDKNTPLFQDPYIYISPGATSSTGSMFVSLAVNTNQYGRTFQDRSYKFAIKKKPTATVELDNDADTPYIPTLTSSSVIYNVNVRGKRGNIVQTFPAVEYDFVPNSLAVTSGDYIHFQWTGSDYNPRRGCNDAEGGPPDPNDFTSTANANDNSRADRSNIIFMNTMAENVPMDMLGYDFTDTSLTYQEKSKSANSTTLPNTPCGDGSQDELCYQQIIRLAYLNQQSDGGASQLRRYKSCLTETELNAIDNKAPRENHPLNCAKLNAKPYPYFDGGLIKATNAGKFAYFSSRNNNFSNRDQTGIICVRTSSSDTTCDVDSDTGILQDSNQAVSTAAMRTSTSVCNDELNQDSAATNNGASSCISDATSNDILTSETRYISQQDNDKTGTGQKDACDKLVSFLTTSSVEQKVVIAISLLFVGLITAFIGFYCYNRWKAHKKGQGANFGASKWGDKKDTEMI